MGIHITAELTAGRRWGTAAGRGQNKGWGSQCSEIPKQKSKLYFIAAGTSPARHSPQRGYACIN